MHLFIVCLKQAVLGQLSSNWLFLPNRRFEQLVTGTYVLKAREHRENILNTEDPYLLYLKENVLDKNNNYNRSLLRTFSKNKIMITYHQKAIVLLY